MINKTRVPYGSWSSPITGEMIVEDALQLSQARLQDGVVYWIEQRPAEGGRRVLMKSSGASNPEELTSKTLNVRTLVHEYGGGDYGIARGAAYFSNFADQRVYRVGDDGTAAPVTPEGPFRYADFEHDPHRNRMLCVLEDHSQKGADPENLVVAISDDPSVGYQRLVAGNDFYSNPRLSPDGTTMAWLSWNHPNMPWDGTELWIATLDEDGLPGDPTKIAGGQMESVFQPRWSLDGSLYYISDPSGWWNLHRWKDGVTDHVLPMDAEFGSPQWIFGLSNYAVVDDDTLLASYIESGKRRLGLINVPESKVEPIETFYGMAASIEVENGVALFLAGSSDRPAALVQMDLSAGDIREIRTESTLTIDPGYLSQPEVIEFPTLGERTAFAIYYPPHQ